MKDDIYKLIKKDLSLIYKYLISIGAAKEDAEDIIQETFIKTYENIDILIDGNIKAWMFKDAINQLRNLGDTQYIDNIDENNIKLNGIVVVVGSPKELKSLQNNPMIKHSIIGNVVDKY